jgi:type IV secretion system protein TrbE
MRALWLLASNYADMALMFATGRGARQNNYLGAEYLLVCETEDRTPYFLNLHHEDVFGVLITGKTGAGKSVLSNCCLDHLMKYDPRVLIADIGGSYRQICRRYDGSYMHLGRLDFRINPFRLPESDSGKRFLAAFVRLLLSNEGYSLTYDDKNAIFEAVGAIYGRDIEQRRLSGLELPKHLWAPLQRWTNGGEYGSVFDNVEDSVTLARLQVLDFQGIDELPEITEPLFFYLFGRFDSVVKDPAQIRTLKVLWADEVWRFLANSTARQYLVSAGKTWRKHKSGIGLATQSAFDLKNAGVLEIINEVTPTKLLLANPSADFEAYKEAFHLNDKEVEKFRGLVAKRQFMLKREEQPAQVLNLTLSPLELARYGNDPVLNAKREQAIAEHGFEKGLEAVAVGGMNQ